MPIIDIQRRMVEVGRIRMGHQVAAASGRRPAKLEHWRLTSRDSSRLEAAGELYGGTVKPWAERDGEFELFTTTAELPILLLPGQTLSQWYESWTAGGCTRRCDGERETISEEPCICDTEGKKERTCKPTTRLSVMLPDVPGLGCWRLESHGYYAAVELSGTAAMLEAATARGQLLPARIRIDQRSKVEGGKTTKYAVPVIDIDITMRQALPGASAPLELERASGFTPVPGFGGLTITDGLAAVNREAEPRTGNGRQAAAIGPGSDDILSTSSSPIPIGDQAPAGDTTSPVSSADEYINDAQRTLLWATVTENLVAEPALRDLVREITGQEHTKQIDRSQFDAVLRGVERLAALREINAHTEYLVSFGKQRGNEDKAIAAITANRDAHADELDIHLAWLKSQIEKAQAAA